MNNKKTDKRLTQHSNHSRQQYPALFRRTVLVNPTIMQHTLPGITVSACFFQNHFFSVSTCYL